MRMEHSSAGAVLPQIVTHDVPGGAEFRAEAAKTSRAVANLYPLWFVRYRMRLEPYAPLVLPVYVRGAILRGAFGITLRKLVCHDLTLECRECPLRTQCAYPQTFQPTPPAGGERLSNFSDIPRPFVFDPPVEERAEFRPGEVVGFGLTVFGQAAYLTPYFVTAFRKLADDGLGPRRARFNLIEVVALGSQGTAVAEMAIYKNTESMIRMKAPQLRVADLVRPQDASKTHLTLRFLTPVDLRDRGAVVQTPEFGPLVRRLRDRASSLAAFFGDGPVTLDFKGVSALADTVRLAENHTRVVTVNRHSARTGQRHDIGGFIGEATYEGEAIGALMPLVRLGEVMHVGKHAAFGNGRIEVVC